MPQASHFNIYIRNTETGKGFDEHHVKTIDKQTECYIESRNGVKFEIFIEINAATQPAGFRNLAYACRVYVDGRRVKTPIMGNIERKRVGHVTVSGMLLPPTELAPFVFGQTVFTEHGDMDSQTLSKLGRIEIEIYRLGCIARYSSTVKKDSGNRTKEVAVNEKAKKALLTHSVKYGNAVNVGAPTRWTAAEFLDPPKKPMHKFTFLYRSRDILDAMGVLPPSRIQHATCASDSPDSDSDSNSSPAAIVEKLRRLKNELRELKRKVKSEPEPEPVKFEIMGSAPEHKKRRIVVDLTI